MRNSPNIKKFPSNKTILLTSILSMLIPSIISILTLRDLSIYLKIIICLSICCFVLLFVSIFYFIKEREYYYLVCYLENNIDLLQTNIKQIEDKLSN